MIHCVTQQQPAAGTLGSSSYDIDDEEILIYPNPTDDYINIELDHFEYKDLQIEISDINGKTIKRFDSNIEAEILKINIEDLKSGIYFLNLLENSERILSKKIIIN